MTTLDHIEIFEILTTSSHLWPVNPVAPCTAFCTMSSQQLEDFKIEGCCEKWPRSGSIVGLKLELLPAFESGDLHDCTIRVGCDLQNSQSSFRVRLEKHE
jgi:hypothetical protein